MRCRQCLPCVAANLTSSHGEGRACARRCGKLTSSGSGIYLSIMSSIPRGSSPSTLASISSTPPTMVFASILPNLARKISQFCDRLPSSSRTAASFTDALFSAGLALPVGQCRV